MGSVGAGLIFTDCSWKISPSYSKNSPVARPRMMSIISSIRLPRRSHGTSQMS